MHLETTDIFNFTTEIKSSQAVFQSKKCKAVGNIKVTAAEIGFKNASVS